MVRHPDGPFFAPLADLEIGGARLYLGLVHHTDGAAEFGQRLALARRYADGFGIGSVCGYGRVSPAELRHALQVHRDCAALLTTGRG